MLQLVTLPSVAEKLHWLCVLEADLSDLQTPGHARHGSHNSLTGREWSKGKEGPRTAYTTTGGAPGSAPNARGWEEAFQGLAWLEQQISRQGLDTNNHGTHNQQATRRAREQPKDHLEGRAQELDIRKLRYRDYTTANKEVRAARSVVDEGHRDTRGTDQTRRPKGTTSVRSKLSSDAVT